MQHGLIEGVGERRSQASQPQARRLALRPSEPSSPPKPPAKRQRRLKRRWWRIRAFWLTLVVLVAAAGGYFGYHQFLRQQSDPVPARIRRSVSFAVYYPQANKLPTGYYLDTSSFSSGDGQEVIYVVRSSDGQRLVFSLQPKPTTNQIQAFYLQHLPLHTNYNTPVGTAAIGAIGPQTIVSLPTNGKVWLLITAPQNIDKAQLQQVLRSIKAP